MANDDQNFANSPRIAGSTRDTGSSTSRDGVVRDREPKVDTIRPGRLLGIYGRRLSDRGFGFIKDATGEEYFAHLTGFVTADEFEGLALGTGVSFKVRETPKGLRAFDIRVADANEQVTIDGWREHVGNR